MASRKREPMSFALAKIIIWNQDDFDRIKVREAIIVILGSLVEASLADIDRATSLV
jgi:hypothetical protein